MITERERIDNIGFGDLRLIQRPEDFCYGVDAVILADFASRCEPKTAIDLGTGTGIIPMILNHKTDAERIVGIEVQKESYELACRSAVLNGLSERVRFVRGDVSSAEVLKLAGELTLGNRQKNGKNAGFEGVDMVCSNPPYMVGSHALINKNPAKTIARHETTAGVEEFIKAAGTLLRDRGHFYMVHRPSRLVDIMYFARKYKLEPKELRFVCPRENAEANILLVHCVKNGGAELKVLKNLYVYGGDGEYTDEINEIYERKQTT